MLLAIHQWSKMSYKSYIILFLYITCMYSCGTYQNLNSPSKWGDMPSEPGKCYAKCLTPDTVEEQILTFEIYTGDDPEIEKKYVKTEVVEIAPATSKWVKKKADNNCLSADPNDCLILCLVETPAQTVTVQNILIDTTIIKEFETETHTVDFVTASGGQPVWMSVICNIDNQLKSDVQEALYELGYDLSEDMLQGTFSKASKEALIEFQKDNRLHIGGFTEETLDMMGIEY